MPASPAPKITRMERQLAGGMAYDRFVTDATGHEWVFTDKIMDNGCRQGRPVLARVVVDLRSEPATVTATYVRVPAASRGDMSMAEILALVADVAGSAPQEEE